MDKYSTARQATDDHTIWCMRFACWINKTSQTNSEYVILTASPQQRLSDHRSMLFCTYSACLLIYIWRDQSNFKILKVS